VSDHSRIFLRPLSSEKQKLRTSLQRQLDRAREYATTTHNLTLDDHSYRDLAVCGWKPTRPEAPSTEVVRISGISCSEFLEPTTLGAAVGLGYVHSPTGVTEDYVTSGRYEIQVSSRKVPARASLKPMLDPAGMRIHR
jgi:hypothetical protein